MRNTVLITGASSGIGYALTQVFASHGHDIVMVAKSERKLKEKAEEIKKRYGVNVLPIARDLTDMSQVSFLYDDIISRGIDIEILINDAGMGKRGIFTEVSLKDEQDTVMLNVVALMTLTHLFLNDMKKKNKGKILNLGSIAGFEPGPLLSVYHGSKAFVVMFTESLMEEYKDTDVEISCLCPGPVDTPFFKTAQMEDANVITKTKALVMKPEVVAQEAYDGLMRGERIIMPGYVNKVMTFTRRIIPLSLQAKINKKFYERNEEE